MGVITGIARLITLVNYWIARLMSYAVLVLFILLLSDVIMRYYAESPIHWSVQVSRLLFGVYAIIGGGYLLARRDHVNVDLFYGEFSKKTKALVDILTSVLFFLIVGVLLIESYGLAADSVARWEIDHLAIWKAPLWPSKVMIVVAAALLLLQGIVKLIADFMILAGIDVDEEAYGPLRDGEDGDKETV